MVKVLIAVFVTLSLCEAVLSAANTQDEEVGVGRYAIEGRVFPSDEEQSDLWQVNTRIHVNGGEYIAFIKDDGSFTIHNVPTGSYVVEVVHADYSYDPVRVEINSKGKFRARRVNYVQTSQVVQVPYPLRMKASGRIKYFQVREQLRVTDLLFNPMVIMMVLPLLLIVVLPKMMNDPETKEDLKNITNMTKMTTELPEMSEMFTNLFNRGAAQKTSTKAKQVKKKQ